MKNLAPILNGKGTFEILFNYVIICFVCVLCAKIKYYPNPTPVHSANLDSIWNLEVYSKMRRNNLILDYNNPISSYSK